jgi:short-subunit dehydrogenase
LARPVAVITGASSGIGAVFAHKLAPSHDLLLIARRRDRLAALASEFTAAHGSAVTVLPDDLTEPRDLEAVAERIATLPDLMLLVNNAGIGTRGLFWRTDPQLTERMQRLHVLAVARLSYAALNNLVPRRCGALINVASVAAFVRRGGAAAYAASKSWVTVFTEALYLELRHVGSPVQVQALCPGFTYTELHDTIQLDRTRIAAPAWWMSAETVVDASLAALEQGRLFVVPGWRNGALVGAVSILPNRLRVAFERMRARIR